MADMKVETDIISVNMIVHAVKMYVETFKTNVIVFINNNNVHVMLVI